MHKIKKILVLFVEPMLYNMDLIHEVYDKTDNYFFFIYCGVGVTGKDYLDLPKNSFVCSGTKKNRKIQIIDQTNSFKPDFVVINGYVGLEQHVLIRYCQKNRVPYAIESDTPLNIPSNKLKAILKKLYLRTLLHNPLCYGFPGGTLQKENLIYYGIPEKRNFIMPMSVSSERIINVSRDIPSKEILRRQLKINEHFVYLFVGRLEKEKNVDLLIEAFKIVHEKKSNIALVIVGDGSQLDELKRKVSENNLRNVYFFGYIIFPELINFYKSSDVLVLPSNYEPWGLVVNEAMINGLPVIVSSKVGCRADLVSNNLTGYIFESENINELSECMNRISRKKISEFSLSIEDKILKWSLPCYKDKFIGAIKYVEDISN